MRIMDRRMARRTLSERERACTALFLRLFLWATRKTERAGLPIAEEGSLLSAYAEMMRSGELRSGDAEERFSQILLRAGIGLPVAGRLHKAG
jgi:hypothetical protein